MDLLILRFVFNNISIDESKFGSMLKTIRRLRATNTKHKIVFVSCVVESCYRRRCMTIDQPNQCLHAYC